MHIVFFSTSHVFEAEERCSDHGIKCKIVPTPVTDKAYCGVCVETESEDVENIIEDMEHNIID